MASADIEACHTRPGWAGLCLCRTPRFHFAAGARGCVKSDRIFRTRTTVRKAPGILDLREDCRAAANILRYQLSSTENLKGQSSARRLPDAADPNRNHRRLPTTLSLPLVA